MKLKALSKADCEQVRLWRNDSLVALRTPYMLTQEQQEEFYNKVVCNREARARFWGVVITVNDDDKFIGMIGFENWEIESRRAEISIIINPEYQGAGYGEQAVEMLLEQGFNYLNIENIWGECYTCNPAKKFWDSMILKYNGTSSCLVNTKYWNGAYYDSMMFNFRREEYIRVKLS
jgi:RimJ/RimL family protein N-acetyltransferase